MVMKREILAMFPKVALLHLSLKVHIIYSIKYIFVLKHIRNSVLSVCWFYNIQLPHIRKTAPYTDWHHPCDAVKAPHNASFPTSEWSGPLMVTFQLCHLLIVLAILNDSMFSSTSHQKHGHLHITQSTFHYHSWPWEDTTYLQHLEIIQLILFIVDSLKWCKNGIDGCVSAN